MGAYAASHQRATARREHYVVELTDWLSDAFAGVVAEPQTQVCADATAPVRWVLGNCVIEVLFDAAGKPLWGSGGDTTVEQLAMEVDRAVMQNKPDNWLDNIMEEKRVQRVLRRVLPPTYDHLAELSDLIKARPE